MTRSAIELKPTGDVVDQVFLTPRVLDHGAFEEFSLTLRVLIEKAGEESQKLQTAAAAADAAHERISRLLPALDARLSEATTALQSAADARAQAVELLRQAQAAMQQLGQMEERLQEVVSPNLQTLCLRAETLLGRDPARPDDAPATASLAFAVLLGERQLAEMEGVRRELKAIEADAGDARRLLGSVLLDASGAADELCRARAAAPPEPRHETIAAAARPKTRRRRAPQPPAQP